MLSPAARNRRPSAGLLGLMALGAVAAAVGQEYPAGNPLAIMKAAKVGEPHELLQMLAGSWNTRNRSWQDPGKAPLESSGTSDQKLIFGGRFLQSDYRGHFMGMPFEGMGLLGYDNLKQQYVSIWIDNMSTAILYQSGQYDPAARTLTMTGDGIDATTGEIVHTRMVTTILSENEHTFAYYETRQDDKELKWMEIIYARQ